MAQELPHGAANHLLLIKLNAEALEMQGKWEPAQLEYEGMIEKEPNAPDSLFARQAVASAA